MSDERFWTEERMRDFKRTLYILFPTALISGFGVYFFTSHIDNVAHINVINDLKKNSTPIIQKISVNSDVTDSGTLKNEIIDTVGYYVPARKLELK